MKSWFPFTDYDFYAYLTSGLIVLFSLDFGLNDGAIVLREKWPFIQIVFLIAIAYIIGQIVAGFSSVIFEHWFARRCLRPPTSVMMNFGKRPWGEQFIGKWIVGRDYEPISENRRAVILALVAKKLSKEPNEITDPEDVFQVAFPVARSAADTAQRMDDFRKLYGFSRNIVLSGIIGSIAMAYRAFSTGQTDFYWWALVVFVLSLAMLGRFLKFYVAYTAEVLRTYASTGSVESGTKVMKFFEIDYIEAGEKSSGDAIALRYRDDDDIDYIHVVDGGYADDGQKICDHIKKYYDDATFIDHVVLTHPDGDHAAGLVTVLEEFDVGTLWMNRPWNHIQALRPRFNYDYTEAGLTRRLKKDYPHTAKLEAVADENGIPIADAFQGQPIGAFMVLSPSYERYLDLVVSSDKTPEPERKAAIAGMLFERAVTFVKNLAAAWGEENLKRSDRGYELRE